jgi:hypothetical protein
VWQHDRHKPKIIELRELAIKNAFVESAVMHHKKVTMTCNEISTDTLIAITALLVSVIALAVSVYFWKKSFRPIITAAVRTHAAGNNLIAFNLVIMNSGTIPAKHIKITALEKDIEGALGAEATPEKKEAWLKCFNPDTEIHILQNGEKTSCSFGTSQTNNLGFWKYGPTIPVSIKYQGWFGKNYEQVQTLCIVDSDSFTGLRWGDA